MFRGHWGWGRRRWYRPFRPYRPYWGCNPFGCLWVLVLPALLMMWIMLGACARLMW